MTDDASSTRQIKNWIEQAKNGDDFALGRLLDHFRPLLNSRAHQSLGNHLQSRVGDSDVIQQTSLSAHQAIIDFRGDSEEEFIKWLLTILDHNILHVVEREKNAAKRSVDREEPGSVPLRERPANITSPSRRAIKKEQREILKEAVDQLPPDQRDAIKLKYLQQSSLAETAKILGKTEDAVSGLLQRGVSQLNKLLK